MHFIYPIKLFVCCQLMVFFLALSGGFSLVAAQSADQDSTAREGVVDTDGGAVPAGGSQPRALDPAKIEEGKTLFVNNCTACHAVTDEVVVGPGLKGINQRRPIAWLTSWIKNSQKVIQTGDKYAVDLFNKFNKTVMPSYDFSDEQIVSILQYIDQQSTGGASNTTGGGDKDSQAVPAGGGAATTPGEGGGGKLGIDFAGFKNHIGVFTQPKAVLIGTEFLQTLPGKEIRSGFAEIIKHCLIADPAMWNNIRKRELDKQAWDKPGRKP